MGKREVKTVILGRTPKVFFTDEIDSLFFTRCSFCLDPAIRVSRLASGSLILPYFFNPISRNRSSRYSPAVASG